MDVGSSVDVEGTVEELVDGDSLEKEGAPVEDEEGASVELEEESLVG